MLDWLTDWLTNLTLCLLDWLTYWSDKVTHCPSDWSVTDHIWLTDYYIHRSQCIHEMVIPPSQDYQQVGHLNYTKPVILFLPFSREEASQLIQRKRVQVHGNGMNSVMRWFRPLDSSCSWMWTDCGIHLLWRKNLSSMPETILQKSNHTCSYV